MSIDYAPFPKQAMFHGCAADEVLFGGAAGPGKSHGLLMEAIAQMLEAPKNEGIILRRIYRELEQNFIRKSQEIIPSAMAKYNKTDMAWTFFNGSVLRFGHAEHEGDVTRYQGDSFGFLGVDELTHFTEYQYTYLTSRVRNPNPQNKKIWPRIRCTSNPGGLGHGWVKKHFIDPAEPFQVWRPEPNAIQIQLKVKPMTRCFIQATVFDNPFIMQNDPEYIARLAALPENQRKALLDGDWTTYEGAAFGEWNPEIHVVQPFVIPKEWRRFRSLDFGVTAPTACLWWAVAPSNGPLVDLYVWREYYESHPAASEHAERILARNEGIPAEFTIADPHCWDKEGTGNKFTGESVAEVFAKKGLPLIPADNRRLQGKARIHELLRPMERGGKPWAQLKVFSTCVHLIRTLPVLPTSRNNPDDVDTHAEDHAYDALRYGAMSRPAPAESPAAPKKREPWPLREDEEEPYGGSSPWA